MNFLKDFAKKHDIFIFALAMYFVIFGGLFLILSMPVPNDDTKQAPTYEPSERASFTPTCTIAPTDGICIEIIDGIPTATLVYTQDTPTPTLTPEELLPTETPTPAPTATEALPSTVEVKTTYQRGVPGIYSVPQGGHSWKPWANYHAITATDSPQYRLQQIAKTDENGLRYIIDKEGVKRLCVAMPVAWCGGTSYDIGRLFDVYMQNGSVLTCVLGDTKKIENSQNKQGMFGKHGELMEFQVDEVRLHPGARKSGTISSIGGAYEGEAVKIVVYGENFLHD